MTDLNEKYVYESQDEKDVKEKVIVRTVDETAFALAQGPVIPASLRLYAGGSLVDANLYTFDVATRLITPNISVPVGTTLAAEYTVAGLATQIGDILTVMPELSAQMFLDRRADYETAIAWIESR